MLYEFTLCHRRMIGGLSSIDSSFNVAITRLTKLL